MDPDQLLVKIDGYVDYRVRSLLLRLGVVHANELRTRTCLEKEAETRRELVEELTKLVEREAA